MTSSFPVRGVRRTDLHQVALMMHGLHRHLGLPPSRATAELLEAQLFGPQPPFACLVAETPEGLGGYACYCDLYNTDYMEQGLWLCDLFVDPALRGSGLGRALLAAVARIAVEQGRVSVWWGVHRSNLGAVAFYDRLEVGDFDVALRELEAEPLHRLAREAAPPADSAA